MADFFVASQSVPTTPSAGNGNIFIDTNAKILCLKDDTGSVQAWSDNAATAAVAGYAADTYVTNSDLVIPSFSLQAKTRIIWMMSASKTAAGVATPTYIVRIGANRTTADTAILTLTGPAQTAIADIGTLYVMLTLRNIGAAGVLQGTAWWNHRGTVASSTGGTGFANDGTGHVEASSGAFDTTGRGGQFIGLSVNGGASAAWTSTQVWAEAAW